MNLIQRLKAAVTAFTNDNNLFFRSMYYFLGDGYSIPTEENLTTQIKERYEQNSYVFMVVDYLTSKAAQVPLKVQRMTPDGPEDLPPDHKLCKLIKQPNPWQGKTEFFQQYYGFKAVTGNTFLYAPKLENGNNAGQFLEMYVMPSNFVQIINGSYMEPIQGYKLMYGDYNITMPQSDVIHDRFPSLDFENFSEWWGMSPLKPLADEIVKSNYGREAQKNAYLNGGAIGIISADGRGPATGTSPFTEAQSVDLENAWKKRQGGPKNRMKVAFTSGQVKYQKITDSIVDLGIFEDNLWTLRALSGAYKLDPKLFGDPEASTYNNVKEAKKASYTDSILPMVQSFCDEFNMFIGDAFGEGVYVCIDETQIPELQQDRETMARIAQIGYNAGAFSPDDVREILGFDRIGTPEMEQRTQGLGRVPVGGDEMPEELAKLLDPYRRD